jgi:hypothetical protein
MGRVVVKTKKPQKTSNPFHFLGASRGNGRAGNGIVTGSGACVVYVGGNANNGGNDGPGYANVNNWLGNANANIGARSTKDFVIDSASLHRLYWWIESAHIRFSTSLERAGHQSASFEVAA